MTGWTVPDFVHVRELRDDPVGRRVIARHPLTRRLVSITYLSGEFLSDGEFRHRFTTESGQLVSLRDTRIERIRRYVEYPDGAVVVADYLPGTQLRTLLRAEGTVGIEAGLVLFKDVLLGLAAGHAAGLVHGDVKPELVTLSRTGRIRLTDFGLFTCAGRRLLTRSTPFYLAPEQWNSQSATRPGDVYAATVVFFECLAGGPPFHAESSTALAALHHGGELPLDAVPGPVRQLVCLGLAQDPMSRPTARGFVAEVDDVARSNLGAGWERRGRHELARLLAWPSPASAISIPARVSGHLGPDRRQPVRLAAVLGGSLLLAVGMASPPLPTMWPPNGPSSASDFGGHPPVLVPPALPGDIAGLRIDAEAATPDRPPVHQPAAVIARAVPDPEPDLGSVSVPPGEQVGSQAMLCIQPEPPVDRAGTQHTRAPQTASAQASSAHGSADAPSRETVHPAPDLAGSPGQQAGEPSTSAQVMSDPPAAEPDGAAQSPEVAPSPGAQDQNSGAGQPANQAQSPEQEDPVAQPPTQDDPADQAAPSHAEEPADPDLPTNREIPEHQESADQGPGHREPAHQGGDQAHQESR